ncbi:MAG: hypothetical protein ACRDFW_05375 [bacterium]
MDAEGRFVAIVKALRTDPPSGKRGKFGSDALKVKGKIFGMFRKGELVLKLPASRVDELVRSGHGRHFDPGHGRLMKEWVSVGTSVGGRWLAMAKEARDFVAAGAKEVARPRSKSR